MILAIKFPLCTNAVRIFSFLARQSFRDYIVLNFAWSLSIMIPEIPRVSPFIPPYCKMFHVDTFFCKHLSYLSPCHAGTTVAMDDDFLARILSNYFLERAHDSVLFIIRWFIRCFVGRNIYSTYDVLVLIFLFTSEIDENKIIFLLSHFFSETMGTHDNCILWFIEILYEFILIFLEKIIQIKKSRNWYSQAYNKRNNNSAEHNKKVEN